MSYILSKQKKKIKLDKCNNNEKKLKIKNNSDFYKELNTLEEVENSIEYKDIIFLLNALYSKTTIKILFEEILSSKIEPLLAIKVVDYIENNNKLKIVYNFQTEYQNILKNRDMFNIHEINENYILINAGEFSPIEYANLFNFLNEYTLQGKIEYDSFFKKEIYKLDRVMDVFLEYIYSEININNIISSLIEILKNKSFWDEETNPFRNMSNDIHIDFQKYIISSETMVKYLKNLDYKLIIFEMINGNNNSIIKKDFYEVYKEGCSLSKTKQKYNIEYADGFNNYFYEMIYENLKKVNIEKDISISNFAPSKKNIQKRINRYKKEADLLINEKIILSERLMNNSLQQLREILIAVSKYKKYCQNNLLNIIFFDTQEIVKKIAQIEAIRYEYEEITINLTDLLDSYSCVEDILYKGLDYVATYTYINESTKKDIVELIPDSPEKEYPLARNMKRHFIIHYGPTNSGKTYKAIERLKEAKSGVYLGPLRLLALEIQEKLINSNIPCSLLTGEEENIIENSNHMSSTVEKLNITKNYEVCVIDECQMIGDPERGFAWTKAILGVQAQTIFLCMGPEALDITLALINLCNDTYELVEHKRRSELNIQPSISLKKENIEKYDAYIVFSKKKVLAVAAELIKMGVKTSMIYGNLPYSVRKKQVERFLKEDTDVIVSTNAIGMGMNLPVRRIIFLENEKFDGKNKTSLKITDIKQIAGRAGRNKEEGFVTSTMPSNEFIKNALDGITPKISEAYLGFSDEIMNINAEISDILKVWKSIQTKDMFKRMDVNRYIELDKKIYLNVSKKDKLKMVSTVFDEKNMYLFYMWKKYCIAYESKKEILKPILEGKELNNLEDYYQGLELYYSFSKNFGYNIDEEWLYSEKIKVSDKINETLIKDAINFHKKCEICEKPMKWDSPFKTCKNCFHKGY